MRKSRDLRPSNIESPMELWIPAQTLDVGKIHVSPFSIVKGQRTPLAQIQYNDTGCTISDVIILSPPLTVISYDQTSSKLILDTRDQHYFATKLMTLHMYLISTLFVHQQTFLGQQNMTTETIGSLFQSLLFGTRMTLFASNSGYKPAVYVDGTAVPESMGVLKQGMRVRVAFQINGIAVLPGNPFRLRLNHAVHKIFVVD